MPLIHVLRFHDNKIVQAMVHSKEQSEFDACVNARLVARHYLTRL
jgi:hypothetical protein